MPPDKLSTRLTNKIQNNNNLESYKLSRNNEINLYTPPLWQINNT